MMRMRILCLALIPTCPTLGACALHPPDRSAAKPEVVSYGFELRAGSPIAIRVTLRVHGQSGGTSRLAVAPDWGGIENCERFIHDLSVHDSAGRSCPIASDPAAPHGWNVSHRPGEVLTASYELRPTNPDPLSDFKTHYEPVVRDDVLHLIGETGLIYPEWLEDAGPQNIEVTWKGFKEHNWSIATSFDAEGAHFRRTLQEFRHGMFFAGKIRIHDRDIRGGRMRVAIYGDDWQFKDPQLVDLVEKIVSVEREFMRDFSDPYFLVTVVGTGPRATPRSYSQGGTGLTNCFAMFLAPGTSVGTDSPHYAGILRLLAHEYFHTWNGGKLATEEPEQYVYWFSEGFTDFYASRLLRRAKLIDDAEWVSRLNETLRSLWLSPVSTAPAETIRRDFWSRQEVQKLPYNRGEVVAVMLDEEIRRASGNTRTLDDFMREMLTAAGHGEKSQTDRLLTRMSKWTSPEFSASLRGIVMDGHLPDPPKRLSEPVAHLSAIDSYRFDPGFDIDKSMKAKVIGGVRDGSAAHAAGLRDGQAIKGVSIYHGDPDHEIELKVQEGDETRKIKYYPRGESVRVPTYHLGAP
jgi:predicted metalloprotease with PDZ domain